MKQFTKYALSCAALLCLTAQAGLAAPASSLSVNAGAHIVGTYGLQVIIPGKGSIFSDSAYVLSAHPVAETHYRMKFWVDPGAMTIPNGPTDKNYFRFQFVHSAAPDFVFLIGYIARSPGTGNYRILYWIGNDALGYEFAGGTFLTSGSTPAPAQIEVEWTRATSGANGKFKLTNITNAGAFVERTDVDCGDLEVDDVYIGYLYSANNGTSIAGSYKFDEFESYR